MSFFLKIYIEFVCSLHNDGLIEIQQLQPTWLMLAELKNPCEDGQIKYRSAICIYDLKFT